MNNNYIPIVLQSDYKTMDKLIFKDDKPTSYIQDFITYIKNKYYKIYNYIFKK